MNQTQIAIIGAGPAGLSAAIAAAELGAKVTVFDENATAGGRLRYRILDGDVPLADMRSELIRDIERLSVDMHLNAKVWGLFPEHVIAVSMSDRSSEYHADQIILATGSTDLPFPFPGGSLPGVMTARGLQIVMHLGRVLPGERIAVIGSGPEADEVVRDIGLAGGHVVVEVDPHRPEVSLNAEGRDGVTSLVIDGESFDVDVVVIAVGRQPEAELSQMTECDHGYVPALGGFIPLRNHYLRTSRDGIIVAGDASGVCDLATGASRR